MSEILENERDMRQLVNTTQALFERTQDLTIRENEISNQLQIMMLEQTKLLEASSHNEALIGSQRDRLVQLERMNEELERQATDSMTELTALR